MTSLTKEQEGVPARGSDLRRRARAMVRGGGLTVLAQLALVRCEAGRTFSRCRVTVDWLRRNGMLERAAWSLTPYGRALVEELVR
jgi:hypothetical protein